MLVLVLNAGSSSQKSCLYNFERSLSEIPTKPLWSAHLDWTKSAKAGIIKVKSNGVEKQFEVANKATALETLLNTLTQGETKVLESLARIDVVGHRVVHGGAKYDRPTVINQDVKSAIASLIPLASNHNPAHLEGIKTIEKLLPKVPQVAVFDTAFHRTMPAAAKIYPLPYEWYEKGIQRYGFHGISHEYCSRRTAQILKQPVDSLKIVTCHLGNGCSLAAIEHGICVDTTMGFSPLEGLMMGTRCGSIDPQITIYMMQEYGLSVDEVNRILNKESGLLGVSGISADLRNVLAAKDEGNTRASLASDIYIHRLRKAIGTMVASLNGLDVLVFTAGVGENSAIIRQKTCEGLTYLGLQLDNTKNNALPVDKNIATENSLPVLVIQTQEDFAIAVATFGIIKSSS